MNNETIKIKDSGQAIYALLGAEGKIEMVRVLFQTWALGKEIDLQDALADVKGIQNACYGLYRMFDEMANQVRALREFIEPGSVEWKGAANAE